MGWSRLALVANTHKVPFYLWEFFFFKEFFLNVTYLLRGLLNLS